MKALQMSPSGHERRFEPALGMSAIAPIATELLRRGNDEKGQKPT